MRTNVSIISHKQPRKLSPGTQSHSQLISFELFEFAFISRHVSAAWEECGERPLNTHLGALSETVLMQQRVTDSWQLHSHFVEPRSKDDLCSGFILKLMFFSIYLINVSFF